MGVKDTQISRWCPNCKDWFDIDEECNCQSHESSSRSRRKIPDADKPKRKKGKREDRGTNIP